MARRLSLLLRGPGILALVLLAVLLVTVETHHGKSTAASATATATVVITVTPLPTSSPVPTVTPTRVPSITFGVLLRRQGATRDRATGMQVRPERALIGTVGSPARPSHLAFLLKIKISNRGRKAARYSFRDFYALAPSGATFAARRVPKQRAQSGRLKRARSTTIQIGFLLPPAQRHFRVIWNDNGRFFPPGTLATVVLTRRVG